MVVSDKKKYFTIVEWWCGAVEEEVSTNKLDYRFT